MTASESWFAGHLRELDRTECLELLAQHSVGRVAYNEHEGPVVLPVNYVVDDGFVLIRVSPHSSLADRLRGAQASFEVDDYDEYQRSGWSVLVRGYAEHAAYYELPPADERPQPWVEGQRTFHVRIAPHQITGRRLLPA